MTSADVTVLPLVADHLRDTGGIHWQEGFWAPFSEARCGWDLGGCEHMRCRCTPGMKRLLTAHWGGLMDPEKSDGIGGDGNWDRSTEGPPCSVPGRPQCVPREGWSKAVRVSQSSWFSCLCTPRQCTHQPSTSALAQAAEWVLERTEERSCRTGPWGHMVSQVWGHTVNSICLHLPCFWVLDFKWEGLVDMLDSLSQCHR